MRGMEGRLSDEDSSHCTAVRVPGRQLKEDAPACPPRARWARGTRLVSLVPPGGAGAGLVFTCFGSRALTELVPAASCAVLGAGLCRV